MYKTCLSSYIPILIHKGNALSRLLDPFQQFSIILSFSAFSNTPASWIAYTRFAEWGKPMLCLKSFACPFRSCMWAFSSCSSSPDSFEDVLPLGA